MQENERRANHRYPLRVFATLTSVENTSQFCSVHLLDISLKGAKLAVLDEHQLAKDDAVELCIELPEQFLQQASSRTVQLIGKIVHCQDHILGVEYSPKNSEEANHLSALIRSLS